MALLQEESELDEIVRLVGIDALSYRDRLTLECTRSIREDYLHQNAYHEVDTYSSPKKQYLLLKTILSFYEKSLVALQEDASFNKLVSLPVREQIGRMKYVPETEIEARCDEISRQMSEQIRALTEG
ncbi:V-type sodium ATPase catalytic subunit A [bioreactor metagenome]|uniref:V-type sodium ATPase catalytic subunit A n=1 Tax=bioreactor metagenome TaxID=1076179 RepID=A0A645BSV1_9ZZZZ